MAVAADSHCDFLIPEHAEAYPTTKQGKACFDELRLFFSWVIIPQILSIVNIPSHLLTNSVSDVIIMLNDYFYM